MGYAEELPMRQAAAAVRPGGEWLRAMQLCGDQSCCLRPTPNQPIGAAKSNCCISALHPRPQSRARVAEVGQAGTRPETTVAASTAQLDPWLAPTHALCRAELSSQELCPTQGMGRRQPRIELGGHFRTSQGAQRDRVAGERGTVHVPPTHTTKSLAALERAGRASRSGFALRAWLYSAAVAAAPLWVRVCE